MKCGPNIKFAEVIVSDEKILQAAAELLSEYSWGMDYPVSPISELHRAEYCTGAFAADELVGFAGMSRFASPDNVDNGELWFGFAVVKPEFRQQGIYSRLYDSCLIYMNKIPLRKLACTDNPIMEKFLQSHGWQQIRTTKDEAGDDCIVYEYKL